MKNPSKRRTLTNEEQSRWLSSQTLHSNRSLYLLRPQLLALFGIFLAPAPRFLLGQKALVAYPVSGEMEKLSGIFQAQLVLDVLSMRLDRLKAQFQLDSDLASAHPSAEQLQYVQFAIGKVSGCSPRSFASGPNK